MMSNPPAPLSEERLLHLDQCKTCGPLFRYKPPAQNYSYADFVSIKYLEEQFFKNNHNKNCKILNGGKPREGNGAYTGPWAFTFTKSPKDDKTVGDMLTAVRKICSQKSQPVARYAWYYEDKGRDENGDAIHPHIHGMIETEDGTKIQPKHWKRAWSLWDPKIPMGAGFKGGYLRQVRNEEKYEDYIKKDGGMSECKLE